jgi:hypothetical protein
LYDADQDGVLDGYAALETMAGEIKTSLQHYGAVTLALMADATFWSMLMSFIRNLYDSLSAKAAPIKTLPTSSALAGNLMRSA